MREEEGREEETDLCYLHHHVHDLYEGECSAGHTCEEVRGGEEEGWMSGMRDGE